MRTGNVPQTLYHFRDFLTGYTGLIVWARLGRIMTNDNDSNDRSVTLNRRWRRRCTRAIQSPTRSTWWTPHERSARGGRSDRTITHLSDNAGTSVQLPCHLELRLGSTTCAFSVIYCHRLTTASQPKLLLGLLQGFPPGWTSASPLRARSFLQQRIFNNLWPRPRPYASRFECRLQSSCSLFFAT